MKIKGGQIVAITQGEYSDYCLRDHMRALKDFDAAAELERFKKEGDYLAPPEWVDKPWAAEMIAKHKADPSPSISGSIDRFLAWLVREKLMDPELGVAELHVGNSYDEVSIDPDD